MSRECSRDGCNDPVGRIDHGGGLYYCSVRCENLALQRSARRMDTTDRVLLGTLANWHHERRMADIRELDIDEWAAEQRGIS